MAVVGVASDWLVVFFRVSACMAWYGGEFRSQGEHDIQYCQMCLAAFFLGGGRSKIPAGGFAWGANVSCNAFSFFCVWCVWRTRGDEDVLLYLFARLFFDVTDGSMVTMVDQRWGGWVGGCGGDGGTYSRFA